LRGTNFGASPPAWARAQERITGAGGAGNGDGNKRGAGCKVGKDDCSYTIPAVMDQS